MNYDTRVGGSLGSSLERKVKMFLNPVTISNKIIKIQAHANLKCTIQLLRVLRSA